MSRAERRRTFGGVAEHFNVQLHAIQWAGSDSKGVETSPSSMEQLLKIELLLPSLIKSLGWAHCAR